MDKHKIKTLLKKWLPKDRFEHSIRVEKTAVKLAKIHKIDEEDASIAAILHDCARYNDINLIQEAEKLGLPIKPIEKVQPKLLHPRLGAIIAQRKFGIKNKNILAAIKKHTVGSIKMTPLEKIVYLADHTEPARDYKGVTKVRKLSFIDLNAAIVECASSMLQDLIQRKLPISEETLKTRNYYLTKDG